MKLNSKNRKVFNFTKRKIGRLFLSFRWRSMVLNFEDLVRKLNEFTLNRTSVIREHEFYPYTYEGREHVITTRPYYIPSDGLRYLNENGSCVGMNLENGTIEFKYGENKSKSHFSRLEGIFEGIIDGREVLGVVVGENVSSDIKNPPKKEAILNVEDKIRVLNEKGLVKDFSYVVSLR